MRRDENSFASKRMTLDQLRLLVRRRDADSPMTESVSKVLEMLSQGESPRALEEYIARYPGLALKVIAMAGSAAFGGSQIKSIRHALELLGSDQLYSIFSTLNLFSMGPKRQLAPGIDRNRFERRCLLMGMLSRTISKNLKLDSSESHYLAGLFLDSGYLVLSKFCGEKLDQVIAVALRTEVGDLNELERYYIGFDHADTGSVLSEESHFSPEICTAIRCHHQPMFAPQEHQSFADLAHVSSWLADELGFTLFEGAPLHTLDAYSVKRLGIEPRDLKSKVMGLRESADSTLRLMQSL